MAQAICCSSRIRRTSLRRGESARGRRRGLVTGVHSRSTRVLRRRNTDSERRCRSHDSDCRAAAPNSAGRLPRQAPPSQGAFDTSRAAPGSTRDRPPIRATRPTDGASPLYPSPTSTLLSYLVGTPRCGNRGHPAAGRPLSHVHDRTVSACLPSGPPSGDLDSQWATTGKHGMSIGET